MTFADTDECVRCRNAPVEEQFRPFCRACKAARKGFVSTALKYA